MERVPISIEPLVQAINSRANKRPEVIGINAVSTSALLVTAVEPAVVTGVANVVVVVVSDLPFQEMMKLIIEMFH